MPPTCLLLFSFLVPPFLFFVCHSFAFFTPLPGLDIAPLPSQLPKRMGLRQCPVLLFFFPVGYNPGLLFISSFFGCPLGDSHFSFEPEIRRRLPLFSRSFSSFCCKKISYGGKIPLSKNLALFPSFPFGAEPSSFKSPSRNKFYLGRSPHPHRT